MLKQQFDIVCKILLPIAIGLGVVWWLFGREFNNNVLHSIHLDAGVIVGIALALLFMFGRDFGMTWRFKVLADGKLTWLKSLKVCLLCEFTSCITPTSTGGSALSMLFMYREGIDIGRATTLTMTTLFFDELFFVISLPVVMALIPYNELFGFGAKGFTFGLQTVFWAIYGIIILWTVILFLGIIVRPKAIHTFLVRCFRHKPLSRWQEKIDALGLDMEATGRELRTKKSSWWIKSFGATAVSWLSRYLVVNALFFAFAPGADQVIVLARQFVVWVILMVSPTPGGAGISEWLFTTYYGDMLSSGAMALLIALFWRILSYYIYLVIGAFMLPAWLRKGLFKVSMKRSY